MGIFRLMPSERSVERRIEDIRTLLKKNYKVEILDSHHMEEIAVIFHGPDKTSYKGGVWRVNVYFPADYPMSPPIISFENKIVHPNIRRRYDLLEVFDIHLLHLLEHPNPRNPFNLDAGILKVTRQLEYDEDVKVCVELYAGPQAIVPVEEKLADENFLDLLLETLPARLEVVPL